MRTLDLEPIDPTTDDGEHESFKFRIEVLRDWKAGDFLARIYRHETFRIPPAFPISAEGNENQAWDEELLVRDTARDWEKIRRGTAEEVVQAILDEIAEIFGLGLDD